MLELDAADLPSVEMETPPHAKVEVEERRTRAAARPPGGPASPAPGSGGFRYGTVLVVVLVALAAVAGVFTYSRVKRSRS